VTCEKGGFMKQRLYNKLKKQGKCRHNGKSCCMRKGEAYYRKTLRLKDCEKNCVMQWENWNWEMEHNPPFTFADTVR